MSCGGNNDIVEQYGDIHLHTGPYPIPVNEASAQECSGSCYYGESWPEQEALANAINNPQPQRLQAINNNPDPSKRYALVPAGNVGGEIGVGCMNTRCMFPNCHGSCNCESSGNSVDEELMFDKEVREPFDVFGVNVPLPRFMKRKEQFKVPFTQYEVEMGEKSIAMILTGLILFLAWYYMNRK